MSKIKMLVASTGQYGTFMATAVTGITYPQVLTTKKNEACVILCHDYDEVMVHLENYSEILKSQPLFVIYNCTGGDIGRPDESLYYTDAVIQIIENDSQLEELSKMNPEELLKHMSKLRDHAKSTVRNKN